MPRKKLSLAESLKALRAFAASYPEANEGIACEGTALEKSTFKARNKSFLFLGRKDLMVKLGDSLPEASALAAKEPGRYKVGAPGWVTVTFGEEDALPLDLLERWIDESYRLLAPKGLLAILADRKTPSGKGSSRRTG